MLLCRVDAYPGTAADIEQTTVGRVVQHAEVAIVLLAQLCDGVRVRVDVLVDVAPVVVEIGGLFVFRPDVEEAEAAIRTMAQRELAVDLVAGVMDVAAVAGEAR